MKNYTLMDLASQALNQMTLSLKACHRVIEENGEHERNVQPWEGLQAGSYLRCQKRSGGSTCPTYQNQNSGIFCSVSWLTIYVMSFPPNMDKCLSELIYTRGVLLGAQGS